MPCAQCGALPGAVEPGPVGSPSGAAHTGVLAGFRGRPAGVGARLAALGIDALVVVTIAAAAWFGSGSATVTAVLAAEGVIALAVWEARRGLTAGNAVLRLRAARDDRPYSPGIGRQLARASVLGAGVLVAGVGAVLVACSAAWDPTGRRRTWADRVAGTLVVAVPRRVAAPQVDVPVLPPGLHPDALSSRGEVGWGAPGGGPAPAAPATPPPPPAEPAALLLRFDTGQSEFLPPGSTAVLGRAPSPTTATDLSITVHDDEGTVSKTHLRLTHDRHTVRVSDLGSTNGTEVRDPDGVVHAVPWGEQVPVGVGARVRIGHREFTVESAGSQQ
nr:RDD family protein [Cellulomonas denverensis]